MSKSTLEIKPDIAAKRADIERRIKADLKELHGDMLEIKERADNAVMSAWQIGFALNEAKKIIKHGDFELWYKSAFGLDSASVSRWTRLAKSFTLKDLPANKREAYLAIGLLPDKDHVKHEGDTPLNAPTHYLGFFNRWKNFQSQVEAGKKKFTADDQVREHLRPMYQWMKGIYGET